MSSLFSQAKKRLELRHKINSKIYDVTTWLAKNYNTHIAKFNQAMNVGQLIKYYMRNIFLEKSFKKCGGKTIPRPSKKSKLSISLDQ